MEEINKPIKNLEDYISVLKNELKDLYLDKNIRVYFRGESIDYKEGKCIPSIYRSNIEEKEVYYKILRRYPEQFYNMSNIDILAKMQHYQVPTRLLDVSTNPLVTLYFATSSDKKEEKEEDCYVYVFKAKKENILTFDSDRALLLSTLPKISDDEKSDIKSHLYKKGSDRITPEYLENLKQSNSKISNSFEKYIYECERERSAFHNNHKIVPKDLSNPVFVKPQFYNTRMKLQSSLFMLFGLSNEQRLTDKEFISEYMNKNVIRIRIPGKSKKTLRAELKILANISSETLFEDMSNHEIGSKSNTYQDFIKNSLK